MAGRYKKVSARRGRNQILGVVLMSLRVTRLIAELARLYSLWKESAGAGHGDVRDDAGPDDPSGGGDLSGADVGAGLDFGGFDSFGGLGGL